MDLIKNVLIVGGGTAGWLTASILAKQLDSASPSGVKVTLVESPNIPTIGVGEGTFPTMLHTLKFIGLDESVFIRECNATFKQAIKFVDWLSPPANGKHSHYYHLFNVPEAAAELDLTVNWLNMPRASRRAYAESVSVQAAVCEAGLAPKHISTPAFQWLTKYAYHLDAGKFAELLKKHCVNVLGVTHLQGTVTNTILGDAGEIKAVVTKELGELQADLFIDCTGFSSLLIGKALNVPFHNKNDVLFVDHAVVMQVPYETPHEPIACHTISTAQEAGWTWDIGLRNRRGIGHVYSSRHTSHERADQVLREYVGPQAEKLESRKIGMQIGYRDKFWEKNCVAIGAAGGFMEPLEATAISMIETGAFILAQQFPTEKRAMASAATKYNEIFKYRWDRIVDFIKMHYFLSKRRDSQFWIDNTDPTSTPDSLLEKLELWKSFAPQDNDFPNGFAMFKLSSYQYILYGMEFETKPVEDFMSRKNAKMAREKFESVQKQVQYALKHLPKHRDLIEQVQKQGFQASKQPA
jgi:tryptophan halogenase